MLIDVDTVESLRQRRNTAIIGATACFVALLMSLTGISLPAEILLGLGAVVFVVYALKHAADLHDLGLDVDSLSNPTKEERMK